MIAHDQNWSMDDWITIAIALPVIAAFAAYLYYTMMGKK